MADIAVSEVFRFVSVPPPQSPSPAVVEATSVSYAAFREHDGWSKVLPAAAPLYEKLVALRGRPQARQAMVEAARHFWQGHAAIADPAALRATFPAFREIQNWLQTAIRCSGPASRL